MKGGPRLKGGSRVRLGEVRMIRRFGSPLDVWLRYRSKSARTSAALFLIFLLVLFFVHPGDVRGDLSPYGGSTTIVPAKNALLFGSSGNVKIDIPVPGIAVRIEVPREFLYGVVSGENDTHWITSNIRNDYYYYNVVDEATHWTYDWQDNASDGACFKPNFSYYDPNAPYCIEIWNYLNSPLLSRQQYNVTPGAGQTYTLDYTDLVGIDYCQTPNLGRFVFGCFSAPKFVMFHNLVSPTLAGLYNFTVSVANRTNILGYPDFVHAWNTTLFVPVSMSYNAGAISGNICDAGSGPPFCDNQIRGKGVVYAESVSTGAIVARAYVNQSLCNRGTCGLFKLTGLAPGSYYVEGSAGVDRGVAYSLTTYSYPSPPSSVVVSANSVTAIGQLPLRRAPLFCGTISYQNGNGNPIPSLAGQPYLLNAGFSRTIVPPPWSGTNAFRLNITVEATDAFGHVFRFRGISGGTSSDSFNVTTGVGVYYVGTDPYGTEFAGLPAPEDVSPSGYSLDVKVWVSGYVQWTPSTATITQSPGTAIPACPNPVGATLSPNPVMRGGGVISGTLQFCNSQPPEDCQPESPHDTEASLPLPLTDALFAGNILVEAYDNLGILRGVTVINGTRQDGKTGYASCGFSNTCRTMPFYITGFSEYYNHSLSGVWKQNDYGLADGTYSLQVYMRGYELTSANPSLISITSASDQTEFAYMSRGGAFKIGVGSYSSRTGLVINGTRAIQAQFPWRFLNSSIPVTVRVYFSVNGASVGYVEALMETGNNVTNEPGVIQFTDNSFTVIFAGQNWSLRDIWFYGHTPTYVTNNTYTISAYTLGYVPQFPGGISVANQLGGFSIGLITLFIANEIDITVPIYINPQTLAVAGTPEYDHVIGQVFSGALMGAEMENLTAGVPTLQFKVFGFGAMALSNTTLCNTNVLLVGPSNLCGQGHFFYISPDGTQFFDYGLDALNYTAALPEFGFTVHFFQVLPPPFVSFNDLFLEQGTYLLAIQMAELTQGTPVVGYCNSPILGICLANPPSNVAPLSWAQVQATNSTYSGATATFDGLYDGVGALFLPAGTYDIVFTDAQYQPITYTAYTVQWGESYPLTPPPLCPIGSTC